MRTPARILAYCRVSSRDQGDKGTSLDGQRERIERWCAEHGYPAPKPGDIYVEIESGGEEKREKRDELKRLLADARQGDIVVTLAVDRWTRDVVAGVQDVRTLLARRVGWQAIDDGIDATTDAGMTALEHRAAGAAAERRSIRRRTVGARNRLRDQGLWAEGPAPDGYRRGERVMRRDCHLHLDVVPEHAKIIYEAFERCAGGASVVEVNDWYNVERGTDRDRRQTWTMLKNRVYCGEIRSSNGAWIKGQHEAIVSRELFERAQAALTERRKGGGPKPHAGARTAGWLLRGLGSCPQCGARMSASYGGSGYYVCGTRLRRVGCDAAYARVERVDPAANDLALARLVELRIELARPAADGGSTPKPPPDFAAARARIAAELSRAETLAVRGALSEDGLRRARERLDDELGRVEVAAGAAARAERAADPLVRRARLADVRQLAAAWAAASVDVRRTAIATLAKTIRVLAADVEIVWRTAEELCVSSVEAHLFAGTDDAAATGKPPVTPKRGRR